MSSPDFLKNFLQARVVQNIDNAIHWINQYPVDSMICFINTYPLDTDLSGGQRYQAFNTNEADQAWKIGLACAAAQFGQFAALYETHVDGTCMLLHVLS